MLSALLVTTLSLVFAGTLQFDVTKEVTFRLFTVQNKYDQRNLGFDKENLTSSGFDFNKKTKIITHGFLNNGSGESCIALRDAYLNRDDVNVIIVDYERIALDDTSQPNDKIKLVGEYVAKFIDFLIENAHDPKKIHLIGHSFGAHVIGNAARNTQKGKIARVTGLDPGLMIIINKYALSSNVAEFVDVIHTCMGIYGIAESVGTVDFYPNGGRAIQPNCIARTVVLLGITCSHYEAVRCMARSIADPKMYPARKCKSETYFESGKCNDNEIAYMGDAAAPPATGDYYLKTKETN